jgi:gentisate 1,2-dioxygenase
MEQRQRVRTREPEPERDLLGGGYRARNAFVERQFKGRIVVAGKTVPENVSRQGRTRWYLAPHQHKDTVLQDWFVFIHDVVVHSGRHIHQGGICLYVLEGHGYTEVDGVQYEWRAGDLILLPLKPGGVEHQHFNKEEGQGCRWLAFIYLPYKDHTASGLKQVSSSADFRDMPGADTPDETTPYNPSRDFAGWPADSFGEIPATPGFNGYFDLIRRRDAERQWLGDATCLLHGDALPWEVNPQGIMQWYLHPALREPATRTYLFYRQEIPPGSRSGCQRHQGGQIVYFLEGRGYTIIDGARYEWEAGDLLQLPLRPDGVAYQHFNASPAERVRLVACEPNAVDALGVDRGSGLVQLENCPEYARR